MSLKTGLIIAAAFFVVVTLPFIINAIIVNRQPVQKEHVEIVGKRITDRGYTPSNGSGVRYHRYVTFKFSDGSEKEFNVQKAKIYDELQEGDIGTLSYKETNSGDINLGNKHFISFEKDS